MNENLLSRMGVENTDRPVSRGEVAAYVAGVIIAERRRIASVLIEFTVANRQDAAMAIADDDLAPDVFGWTD